MTVAAAEPSARRPRRIQRLRRRTVFWIAAGVGVAFAVFIACLATIGSTNASSPLKGKLAPPLTGHLLGTTKTLSLSQFSGKWVLVNFAASWCQPCHQEMPQLLKFNKSAPHYNAVLLTVAYQTSDVGNLHKFLAGEHATWPAITAGSAAVTWGVSGLPTTYIVDPAGIVVGDLLSGVNATGVETAITKASGGS